MNGISERKVQAIWYDAALRPPRLYTRRGSPLRVLSPGEWNTGAGPDFRNAVLEIGRERRRVVGDVEIHICPSDWDFHHHGADPRYRNVIAHVTWNCGPVPRSLPAAAVSVWLGRFVVGNPAFDPAAIDLEAYPAARLPLPIRPCEEKYAHAPDRARADLAAAGRHRLRMKARRLAGRLVERAATGFGDGASRRQVFYEEVMTALGYSENALAFRRISERVPLAYLEGERTNAVSALCAAGAFEEWHLASHRPRNRPAARLAKAAQLFAETPILDFADATDFSRASCRAMIEGMRGAVDSDGRRCLGRGRASAILANVIVPWAIAEGRLIEAPEWLPIEDISVPMRLTALRLFGRDHNPTAFYADNDLLAQGLLQIRRDCCLENYPECTVCPLTTAH